MIRILLVDDHPFFRQGVSFYIDSVEDFQLVGEASSGEQALEHISSLEVDVVLMDLQMKGMDGISTTKKIAAINPSIRILILTSYGHGEKIQEALVAGAAGYCLKDSPPDELTTAIRAIAEGGTYLGRGILPLAITQMQQGQASQATTSEVSKKSELPSIQSLTQREQDVLRLLAKGHSNKEIAELLFVSEKTVKTHVANILQKLDVNTRTQAAILANQYDFQ